MIETDNIKKLVEKKLAGSEAYPVEISVRPDNLIYVEIDNDQGVSIDDCVALSRFIEQHLDREKEDFELQVSSSGLTSPFKVTRQYRKYIGKRVEMQLKSGEKLTGVLKDADDRGATLSVAEKNQSARRRNTTTLPDQTYAYDEIKHTKYLIEFK
jgi:ribosome maturation factor RimP